MATDPAQEWRQMQEVYSRMSEDELQHVADTAYELTDVARQVLEAEISGRGLTIKLNLEPAEPVEEEPEQRAEFDPADLELTDVHTAWDVQEARTAKWVLDNAHIPSYLGPGHLEKADDYRGSYDRGVKLWVPAQFEQMALLAFRDHWPKDDSAGPGVEQPATDEMEEESDSSEIHCPKCKSDEVVFLSIERQPDQSNVDSRYNWRCDACGNEWQDDGVEV